MAKSKYDTHVAPRLEEIKDWVRNGATDEEIISRLGISRSAFYEYKKNILDFSDTLKETKDFVDGKVESALLESALKGNVTAQIFWLKNRRPDKWREKVTEGNKNGDENNTGSPVFEFVFKDMTMKENDTKS